MASYIRFDWAMKRLLRNKANYAVLEGLMCSLLNEKFKIKRFLDSESNQYSENDKFNRVDILAENQRGQLVLFEIQNTHEFAYFQCSLYWVSKAISDCINQDGNYGKVRKIYIINIVYFTLGQAEDYVYQGNIMFQGLHENDILKFPNQQSELSFGNPIEKGKKTEGETGGIFPEYYLLFVNNFDNYVANNLDEWIDFLRTGDIRDGALAPGLSAARECLKVEKLSNEDKTDYVRYMENLRYQRSVIKTGYDDGLQEGRAEGLAEGEKKKTLQIAKKMLEKGLDVDAIMEMTNLTREEVGQL